MKSFKDISWQVEEPVYREDIALSYSTLAKYERGGRFNALPTLFDKQDSSSLRFGSYVDCWITEGKEVFDSRYYVCDLPNPSDKMAEVIKGLYQECISGGISYGDLSDSIKIDYANTAQFEGNRKDATRIADIDKVARPYIIAKLGAKDKEIIPTIVYNDVVRTVEALKESPATKEYFREDNPFDNVERYYQLKFKMPYKNLFLRCMADLIIVDHNNKVIIPCDLKTTGNKEYEFPEHFVHWQYQIQARLYWRIIRDAMDKDDYFRSFKLLDYRFIVVNKQNCQPLIWEFDKTQCIGDITLDSGFIMRDPYTIADELHEYLSLRPDVPFGIKTVKRNDIMTWLNKK